MDSLTHIVLGACVGEVVAGKKLGKKALLVGAAAQSIPDLDFIASFWLSPANDLLAHRGFTHSFLFILLIAYPLALILIKWKWLPPMAIKSWTLFLLLELFIHIFLDAFNAYGTAWFEPFSHYRVSFNSLFVFDPLFTIWPVIATAVLLIYSAQNKLRIKWAWMGIVLCTIYLADSILNKQLISTSIETSLAKQGIDYTRYFSTPTPANTWLWYIVAEDDKGLHVGYRSVFDDHPEIRFQFFSKNQHLLDTISNHENLQRLIRFSEGYYTVTTYQNRLVFNDLRFGQMDGWSDPHSPFVFYYFLNHPADNELLIQRGRFARWNRQAFHSFIERIKGN